MKNRLLQNCLLITFFKTVYVRKPKLFYFILSFCIIQLGLTVIKLEVTPFFLYGMFSEKTPYTGQVTNRQIFLDNKEIQSLPLTGGERYFLALDLDNYLTMKENKGIDVVQSRVEAKYPFFTNSFLYPLIENKIYNSPGSLLQFEAWFKQKCSQAIKTDIHTVRVVQQTYLFDQHHLSFKLLSSETIASF